MFYLGFLSSWTFGSEKRSLCFFQFQENGSSFEFQQGLFCICFLGWFSRCFLFYGILQGMCYIFIFIFKRVFIFCMFIRLVFIQGRFWYCFVNVIGFLMRVELLVILVFLFRQVFLFMFWIWFLYFLSFSLRVIFVGKFELFFLFYILKFFVYKCFCSID